MFKNQDFIDSANALLAERLEMYAHLTAITPACNGRKNHLSFYINRRNRARLQPFQHTQEMDASELGVADYTNWLAKRDNGMNNDGNVAEPIEANADRLPDDVNVWGDAYRYSEGQIEAASKILSNLSEILTPTEQEVWRLKDQGLGVGEIADMRNVSAAAISKTLSRCERKVRAAYAAIRTAKDDSTDAF